TRSTRTRPYQDRSKIVTSPCRGDVAPETPEVGLRPFFISGRGRGHDMVLARVQAGDHPPDAAALAGRIPALEYGNDRALLELAMAGQESQSSLVLLQLHVVARLGEGLRSVERAQELLVSQRAHQGRSNCDGSTCCVDARGCTE